MIAGTITRRLGEVVAWLLIAALPMLSNAAQAQEKKPNILFIMGDDIGWMQPSIYHRGLMVGETPNIDRIGKEGAMFMDYVAMQSCTSGRNAFFTGMYPLRTGMISARTIWVTTPKLCRRHTASRNTGDTSTTWTRCRA
jgi:arylsulfatase A-like enzyme